MEYDFIKHSTAYCENFLDTVNEQIVDADITLPDYCPDIEKILKCTLIPKIHTRHISGGQLTFDGVAVTKILYCDSIKHNVRCFENTSPFTATFNLKSTPQQYIILGETKCEYINCRALSPRKLVVHGAFSLYARVISKSSNDFYSFDEECDLQTKTKEITVSDMCSMCQEQFSVTEDISLDSKPEILSVLSCDTTAKITSLKSIHNKLMLNAQLNLKILYLSDFENSKIEHYNTSLDINKIFDCDGVTDESINIPILEVLSSDIIVNNDTLNDGTKLSLDVKLCFSDISYEDRIINIVEDAYSTKYLTDPKHTTVVCQTNHQHNTFTHISKTTLNLDNTKISKILDVYCDALSVSPMITQTGLSFSGKTNVCILTEDDENNKNYVERTMEIDFTPEAQINASNAEVTSAVVNSVSFRLTSDSTIEVRIEIIVSVVLSDIITLNPITSVEYEQEKMLKKNDSALILYFADKGESLWDIAKSYKTRQSLLMSENSLEDNVLNSSQMLLVVTE